ncbi:ABC transporter ATP-binding protein [Acaryochloris marina]|uniref:Ferrichrome ABC transporter n=1 Tax=Acaryochloris marina (strain MBIC 11017) TaxID=329726 RepID=B0BZ42_ACAM1|nr:ABC transporter ATP-binding protein [Acaryochloris marina]ABW28342.1 ferrichrome ABC transporter [Acaryochloris marina MBIC11017]BDM77363.1 iron-enterobactin transporter ATP-binding protein [Acaryochloris marina MBIC10699]
MITNTPTYALTTRKLTLAYEGKVVIESLDLAIPTGKITILVGPNGCGKSTLLKGLGRLLKPKQGVVYLESESIAKLSTKAIAKRLGLLPQSPSAPEGLTVRDLVAQGRYPHQGWLQQWSHEDEKQVDWALSMTQMQEFAHCALDNLSGGQRQRAWIAMALAQNTDILLLDEPTTYLDLAHQIEVLDLLHDLNEQQGKTIVMVLHDLNQACRFGDYLVAIKGGAVYDQGHPERVMTETMVQNVFGLESRIINDPVANTPLCIPISRKSSGKVGAGYQS